LKAKRSDDRSFDRSIEARRVGGAGVKRERVGAGERAGEGAR